LKKTVVVSTKAGGIPEAIVSNTNGLLTEIKDYKGLANHIYTLATHKELREQFSEEAYSLVLNKFTTEQLAMNTLSVYNQVLNDEAI
jgi:glycosyltransferase involved in cell wall biosynthesis